MFDWLRRLVYGCKKCGSLDMKLVDTWWESDQWSGWGMEKYQCQECGYEQTYGSKADEFR